ncbi:hypothetical protein F5Y05DRAFT_381436 [Hypoxylon sp. FL0543]|nr:hypothetical protein F5Y05DRAFT_381436 [Hypoxylon sp. FL0543]
MDAWELGVQKHLASLPPAERKAFMAPATVDDCMVKIHAVRHRHRQIYHRLVEKLRPVIEPLQRFQGAIDVACQVSPSLMSPVWGPIRAVITLASDRIATLQTLSLFLERLVEPLKRFETYENVFGDNPTLRSAIGALYCDLIDFCTRTVRFYGKSSVRTIFGSFDREFREVSDNIRHHWTEIDIAANFVHITQASAIRKAEEERRQIQVRGDIQRWLSPATVSDDLAKYSAGCMEGSCDWFFYTDHCEALVSSPSSHAVRIVGRPGQGKTTLSAWIISRFLRKPHKQVLYFFCKASDPEKRQGIHVLRTLLSQILRLHEECYVPIEKWYQSSGRPVADSYSEICDALLNLLPRITQKPTLVIIDAIDECSEPQELITTLQKCQSMAPGPFHIILTSRDYPDLQPLFKFVDGTLSFPVKFTDDAIGRYVASRVSELDFAVGKGLSNEVARAVTRASDGLWLYARLALDELSQASSPSEVRRLSQSLPVGLRSLYNTMLSSSESRFTEVQIRIAQEIFIWIDGADYMPWWHFHSDDILEDNALTQLIQFANGGEEVFNPVRLIQKLCFPLLNVLYTTVNGESCPFAANFVHYSAEQYIQWTSDADTRLLPRVLQRRKLRRLYRGLTAAWYFTKSEDFRNVLQELRNDPYGNGVGAYFEMAYGMGDSWHMTSLPDNLSEDDKQAVTEVCGPLISYITTTECIGWAEAAILINYAGGFTNLLENVQKAVDILAGKDFDNTVPAWRDYVKARRIFFTDFTYILKVTGPGYNAWDRSSAVMPDGFEEREVATAILALGRRYKHYVDEAPKLTGLSGETIEAQDVTGKNSVTREWQRRRSSQEKFGHAG